MKKSKEAAESGHNQRKIHTELSFFIKYQNESKTAKCHSRVKTRVYKIGKLNIEEEEPDNINIDILEASSILLHYDSIQRTQLQTALSYKRSQN